MVILNATRFVFAALATSVLFRFTVQLYDCRFRELCWWIYTWHYVE